MNSKKRTSHQCVPWKIIIQGKFSGLAYQIQSRYDQNSSDEISKDAADNKKMTQMAGNLIEILPPSGFTLLKITIYHY